MTWHKSSRSEDGNCVEVRGDLEALRDSKSPSTVLPVSRGALRNLLAHVR